MYRATTPEQIFNLKTDAASLDKIVITYTQAGQKVIEKTKADCTIDGTVIKFTLTQAETKLFSADKTVYIQVRYKTTDGKVIASDTITAQVYDVLNEEVL